MSLRTFGAPIKSSKGRLPEHLADTFDRGVNKDLHFTHIGNSTVQWNTNTGYSWVTDNTATANCQTASFEIPAYETPEHSSLPSMEFETYYTPVPAEDVTISDDHSVPLIKGSTIMNFGHCKWYEYHASTSDTCNSFIMNPVYNYCPQHMNAFYNENGWESTQWHVQYYSGTNEGIVIGQSDHAGFDLRKLSAEELAERAKRDRENNKERYAADFRASELLKKWLSDAEWNYLQEHRFIELKSKYFDEDVTYIVRRNANSKIGIKVKGKAEAELCLRSGEIIPNDDEVLSKILIIKTDEEKFLKTAILYPLNNHTNRSLRDILKPKDI